jgi:hypothetical protein
VLQQPGFPYGRYTLCAQRTVGTTTTHGHADVRSYDNNSSAHTDETVVNTAAGGNAVGFNSTGSVRIWLKHSAPCH